MNMLNHIKQYCGAPLMACALATMAMYSCKEDIDERDLYTFTGEMMTDYFEHHTDSFSNYLSLLNKIHLSKHSSSTMKELLDARGNYTCFAPTDGAIKSYLDSLLAVGEVETTDINEIPDSVAEYIVFNSIIDNGNSTAFMTTDFVANEPLSVTNMNNRYITPHYTNDVEDNTLLYINAYSKVINGDIEVENGYIHTIDHVISPSKSSIAEMIMATANTQMFGRLLEKTGWDKKINKWRDTEWEEKYYDKLGEKVTCRYSDYTGKFPKQREYGYTIFVETDDVLREKLSLNEGATETEFIEALKSYVQQHNYYDDDTNGGHKTTWTDNDFDDDRNWLNQFVAYHILPEKLVKTQLVVSANEYGRDASDLQDNNKRFTVNVWEYWETMGIQRRSLKVTGLRQGELRINRKSIYNPRTYNENKILSEKIPGIRIETNVEDNDCKNGIYWPIEDILIWNEEVATNVLNERQRYDVTALLPEMMTNNMRQNREDSWFFPTDYFDNICDMTYETEFEYMPNTRYEHGGSWLDYQIDEFNIRGPVDFTMKLPPVPRSGTYEVRFGVWVSDNRGMVQVYLGEDPKHLPAIGTPLDLRSTGTGRDLTGWVEEKEIHPAGTDSTSLYENQKTMRNLGFMKGPKYITATKNQENFSGGCTHLTARDTANNVRKIIYTGDFEAGQTYWIRFKSVLNNNRKEFFYDFIEMVPKSVFNGERNEDIW